MVVPGTINLCRTEQAGKSGIGNEDTHSVGMANGKGGCELPQGEASYIAALGATRHRAAEAAGIRRLGTHAFRHTYRSWLDAVGTSIAVQQKLMRHADICTTFNIYGDVVTNEMEQAHSKVVGLALSRA